MSLLQRYQIQQPMEIGPGVSVYACRERSPDSVERVLTLAPQACDRKRFRDYFLSRKELVSPFLIRVRDVAYRGRRIGVISDKIPREYAPGALGHVSDKKRFAFDLVRLFHWLSRKDLFLGVVAPHQLFIRNDGQWVANLLGPRSLFKKEWQDREFLSRAAPEYIEAKRENQKADLYSLGLLLYELFTCQPPFTAQQASDLAAKQQLAVPTQLRHLEPSIDKTIDELILGLLEKRATDRPELEHALAVLNPHETAPKWIPHQLRARLVGLHPELARFENCFEEYLQSPRFSLLSLSGSSGIGKTRLASEFEVLARVKGFESLRVACFQDGTPLPLLRQISRLTGIDPKSAEPEQASRALADNQAAASAGCLIVADDLHWLDEGDGELLRWLVILDLPIMVISTVRPEEANKSWKQLCAFLNLEKRIIELDLGVLNPKASRQLLSWLSPASLSTHDLQTMASQSLGNPYYLVESLRYYLGHDRRSLPPPRVQESLIARINQQSEVEKKILDTLAVTGAPMSAEALRRITQRRREFDPAVERLKARELVQTHGSVRDLTLSLTHDWVGVTVLSGLSVDSKRHIHAAIAAFTESDCSGSPDGWEAVSLARHWLSSDTPDLSRPYLERAVETLVSHSLFRAAAQIRLHALRRSVASDWAALEETLQLLHHCGELATIRDLVDRALANPVELSDRRRSRLYRYLGRAQNLGSRWDLAVESFTSALQTAEAKVSRSTELLLKAELLIALSHAGRVAEATGLFEELRYSIPSSDEEQSKCSLAYCIYCASITGNVGWARSHMLESLRATDARRLSPGLIGRLSNLAVERCFIGDLEGADKLATYCDQKARMVPNPDLSILLASNQAGLKRKQGQTRRSLETVETVSRLVKSTCENPVRLDHFAMLKAKNLAYLLLFEEALQQLGGEPQNSWWERKKDSPRAWSWLLLGRPLKALASVPESRDPSHLLIRSQRQMARTQAYLQLGQLARARKEAEETLGTLPEYLIYPRTKAHQQMGLVCLAEEGPSEAIDHFEISLRIARDQFYFPLMARGYALKGKCLALLGNPAQGRVFAARALQVISHAERPGLLAEIYRILGQILTQLNRHEEARLNFVKALRILREKSLQLSAKYRPKFNDLWIGPIEKELAELARSRRSRLSSLQAVERFAARSSSARNVQELGQEMVQAITSAVAQSSASLRRVHANGRASTIAEEHSGNSRSGQTTPSEGWSLKETFRVLGVGRLDLSVTSHNGGFSESEYDLIKCHVRIMEGLRPDWNESLSGRPKKGQETHLELADGRRIVGRHPEMLQLFSLIRKIGPTGATVLIHGESGTGKELIARAVHDLSSRAPDTWIALNCAAFPSDLIESELFGYRKGSFTGAGEDRPGLVEAADGGTLFLDEIASMPLEHQSRLLRVLQEKTVRRLGESSERRVDVRIIAATNQSLDALVERGEFREDLFHRLNVIQMVVPPLRERASDIPLLAGHFLKELEKRHGQAKEATAGFLERLESLRFSGNVRELHNLVEQAFLLSPGKQLRAGDINISTADQVLAEKDKINGRSRRLFQGLVRGEVDFWPDIRERFLARDLSRLEVRGIISLGLASTDGSYRQLVRKFHLPEKDYRRFLAFLSHHKCKVDFRPFRNQETSSL